MKRLVLIALLACVPSAFAQDKKDEKKEEAKKEATKALLPITPFKECKEGDWTAFKCTMKGPGVDETRIQSWKVTKVADDEVTVELAIAGEESTRDVKFARKTAPSIASYLDMPDDEKVSEPVVTDEKKTVLGKELACKKVVFVAEKDGRKVRATLWLCPDVKGSGLVAIHLEMDLEEQEKAKFDFELAGSGPKDKVELGKSIEDLLKELKEKEKDQKK